MFELTNPQKSIWLMEQFYRETNINNICATLTINKDVDFEKLNKAINIFIQNNKSFGLNFQIKKGSIRQYFTQMEEIQFEVMLLKNKSEVRKEAEKTAEEIFKIDEKRLFKFKLFKLENNYGGFIILTHHIISDAATMSIIGREIVEIYTKLIDGEEISPKEYSYEQFINDEKDYLQSQKFLKDKQYWTEMFNTVPEVATIPSSKNTLQSSFTGKSTRKQFIINNNLLMKIIKFCNQNKVSNFNFFMAVYAIYLGRISNLEDFVIGTPILNRANFKEKHTTGMFINTAPLRIKIENNVSFIDFVKSIAQDSLAMFRHQKYPYQMLLEELRKKDSSLPLLYDVMLSYQITKANDRNSEIPYEVEWIPSTTISNSIYIHLHDNDDEGTLNIDYDYQVEKYEEQDIENMHERILYIIDQILKNENCPLHDIEIVTEREKNILLYEFNNTKSEYEKDKTVAELFEEQVNRTPDDIAVVYGNQQITYKELNERANSFAHYLSKQGVKKQDIIPVLLNRDINLIISMISIIKIGAIYLPISLENPKERIEYIIKDCESKIIVTNKINNMQFEGINPIYVEKFQYEKYSRENIKIKNNARDIIYIIYTSGSTGKPKGVKITNKNLHNFINAFTQYFGGVSNKDSCLSSTNIGFDVNIFEIFIALLNGAKLYLYQDNSISDIFEYCNNIIKNKITLLYIPPNILESVYNILSKQKNINMSKLLIGVEPIKSDIIKKYYKLNPYMKIVNAYGPTETTICATANPLGKQMLDKYNIIPIGRPIKNLKVLILDKNLQLVPIGTKGELYITGDGVGEGYLNNKEKNDQSFVQIYKFLGSQIAYKTGDLVKWNQDGTISFIRKRR